MEHYLRQLNDYFCENYCNYGRISAIEGYVTPTIITVDETSNLVRRDESLMLLCNQEEKEKLLSRLQDTLLDSEITFSFSCPTVWRRIKNFFRANVFHKRLPKILAHSGEKVSSLGQKLAVAPHIYKGIVRGKFLPEKNVVFAIALTCRLSPEDAEELLRLCNFEIDKTVVRDVVVGYLIEKQIFNEEMIRKALELYSVKTLPIVWTED